jgi:DNA-binding CsgD family transcriptional regulator
MRNERQNLMTNEPVDRLGVDQLTNRESEIVGMVARGLKSQEIARQLSLSLHTVNTHLRRAYRKVGVHNRTSMAALWQASVGHAVPAKPQVTKADIEMVWGTSRLCACPHCGGDLVVIRNMSGPPNLGSQTERGSTASRDGRSTPSGMAPMS